MIESLSQLSPGTIQAEGSLDNLAFVCPWRRSPTWHLAWDRLSRGCFCEDRPDTPEEVHYARSRTTGIDNCFLGCRQDRMAATVIFKKLEKIKDAF